MDSNSIDEQNLSWRPTKRFGRKRYSPSIGRPSPHRLSIRYPLRHCVWEFSAVFLGGILILFQLYRWSIQMVSFEQLVPVFFVGGVFVFLGMRSFLDKRKPTILDLNEGFMWKGKRNFYEADPSECVHLSKVSGVQLLAKMVKVKSARFATLEINLVLEDHSRIHLVDIGSKPKAMNFVNEVSEFLNIPSFKRMK